MLKLMATVSLVALVGCSSSGGGDIPRELAPNSPSQGADQGDEQPLEEDGSVAGGGTSSAGGSSVDDEDTPGNIVPGDNSSTDLVEIDSAPNSNGGDEIPDPNEETLAGDTAFENAQAGVESLPLDGDDESTDNLPTFNLDGSVGRSSFSEQPATATSGRIVRGTINGETFSVNLDQNTDENGGVFISEEGNIIVPDGRSQEDILLDTASENTNLNITPFIVGTNFDSDAEPTLSNAGFIIEGNLPPTADLPSQANYSGRTAVISLESIADTTPEDPNPYTSSNFTATATFGQTNTFNGSLTDPINGESVATIKADISGNTFNGTITDNAGEGSISLDGGFFGPNAEEVAGAGSGVLDGDQFSIGLLGSRTDNVPTN